jgi:hypothetical protein
MRVTVHGRCIGVWEPALLSRFCLSPLPVLSRSFLNPLPLLSVRQERRRKNSQSFAPEPERLVIMTMSKKELDAFRRTIVSGPYKSPLFWWLVEQYGELTADGASSRQNWSRHCETMARDGVVDARGKPPNVEAARKAWQVVRKEVAAGRVRRPVESEPPPPRKPSVEPHRSRQRENWQPPVTRAEKPVSARPAPPVPTQQGDEHLSERVRAQLAAVDDQLAYLDRHIIRPKQRT